MATQYIVVLTTYNKEETGSKITQALLSAKLAACVQTLPIQSFYTWKGTIAKDGETLVLIKAKAADFQEIRSTILANHDYETPEVISVNVADGSSAYLKWIDEVTK